MPLIDYLYLFIFSILGWLGLIKRIKADNKTILQHEHKWIRVYNIYKDDKFLCETLCTKCEICDGDYWLLKMQ